MRTKWVVLQEQAARLREQLRGVEEHIEYLEKTPALVNGQVGEHIHCGTCSVRFETEADFAKHYLVPDERYLNLGRCPKAFEQEAQDADHWSKNILGVPALREGCGHTKWASTPHCCEITCPNYRGRHHLKK